LQQNGSEKTLAQILLRADLQRFPLWMWRNTDVVAFIDWLKDYNRGLAPSNRVGFYGMDSKFLPLMFTYLPTPKYLLPRYS
jgi:erythromycin esterase-like protein